MKILAFPSDPKLKMLVSSGPKRIELIAESCAGQPVICRPADMSVKLRFKSVASMSASHVHKLGTPLFLSSDMGTLFQQKGR